MGFENLRSVTGISSVPNWTLSSVHQFYRDLWVSFSPGGTFVLLVGVNTSFGVFFDICAVVIVRNMYVTIDTASAIFEKAALS